MATPAGILLVLGLALALRVGNLAEWSLWEDEETSLHFAQNLDKPFPRSFPVFFVALHGWFRLTGVSVVAGRALAVFFGLAGIGLTYVCFRRLVSHPAALLGALFVALSLGHLFWSQSIRYYTLVLDWQLLCLYWFLDGFERGNLLSLLLCNAAFVLALWTHFSAVLLAPVLVAYLLLALWRRESGAGYRFSGYLTFTVPFLLVMGWFAWRFREFQQLKLNVAALAIPGTQGPLDLLLRVSVYFGAPVIVLGLLAPLLAPELPRRILWFLLLAGVLPILELVVIAQLSLAIAAWYYILFAQPALAVLAGASLASLYRRGRPILAVGLGTATLLSFVPFLVGYFTSMHGDRPRWAEATAYLRQAANVRVEASNNPAIFASVPGVVAYYLGVDSGQTMGHPLVRDLPAQPPEAADGERWYVVEGALLSPEYQAWFDRHCTLEARFEAKSGPKDRTLMIYHCPRHPRSE
jgi:uncharacterized membrane protein